MICAKELHAAELVKANEEMTELIGNKRADPSRYPQKIPKQQRLKFCKLSLLKQISSPIKNKAKQRPPTIPIVKLAKFISPGSCIEV
jgi:hypothetical protein